MNIILGGTHGLGGEIAKGLRARGKDTFVVGRSYDEQLHGKGMAVDLLQRDDADELAGYIRRQHVFGRHALEGFYWVAGYGYTGDFADQPRPRDMMQANLSNVIDIAQVAWKALIAQDRGGRFGVVSSTTGIRARDDEAVYAATKHAQVGFTRSLGLESKRLQSSVKVALYMPGGMQTPFWDGKQPDNYETFLDASKVAHEIVTHTVHQDKTYEEIVFERGSL